LAHIKRDRYHRSYTLTKSKPVTKDHGEKIQRIIDQWEVNPGGTEPPTLQTIGEQLGISRERVRQICIQLGIERPQAKRGNKRTRTETTCKDCGNILPFRKRQNVSVTRCPTCNPLHIKVECNNCGTEFTLIKSIYEARLRKEKGYKGNLYCTRKCFFDFQERKKWWETSPIVQITTEHKVSMTEAVKIYQESK